MRTKKLTVKLLSEKFDARTKYFFLSHDKEIDTNHLATIEVGIVERKIVITESDLVEAYSSRDCTNRGVQGMIHYLFNRDKK